MRNLVRIATVKSSVCFYENLSSSSIFCQEDKFTEIVKSTSYVVRMSSCWSPDSKLCTSFFSLHMRSDIIPFSFCWKSKLFFSHECFRNASIANIEDFEISSYNEHGFSNSNQNYLLFVDIQDDYIFHMRSAFTFHDYY